MAEVTIKDMRSALIAKLWFRRGIRRMILAAYPGVKLPRIYVNEGTIDTEKGTLTVRFDPIPEDIFT